MQEVSSVSHHALKANKRDISLTTLSISRISHLFSVTFSIIPRAAHTEHHIFTRQFPGDCVDNFSLVQVILCRVFKCVL